jgi:hypothetical protein
MAGRTAIGWLTAFLAFSVAQDIVVKDADLTAIVARLASPRQPDRATAFYDLVAIGSLDSDNHAWPVQLAVRRIIAAVPARTDELTRALVALLDREDAETASGRATGDGYGGDLVGAVAALRDSRALPGLLRHIASGRVADRGLSALGDPAVAPVMAIVADANPLRRVSAIITLAGIVAPDAGVTVSPANQTAIRETLVRALADDVPSVRIEAARGVAPLRGADVSAALKARLTSESDKRVVDALKTALAGRQ